ncbi:copii coat assembly protein sec16 [Ophiostoma piceae UAMH 11346]|uniref:Protein transport protein sec16 n=1 Tax=Ophiostoma piceae (strain UAMH 11346) TaxID=1262450 RepID=S3BPI8_OPHP1|nr:copii coat assembly protein sec16 [Ophiostoma piceae UAMH 11346]
MSTNGSAASWNPAFMPHHTEKPASTDAPAASQSASVAKNAEAQGTRALAPLAIGLTVDTLDETAADAWFPEYDAASPWTETAPSDAFESKSPTPLTSTTAPGPEAAPQQTTQPEPVEADVVAEDPQTAQTFTPQTPDLSEDAAPEQTETTPIASPVDSARNSVANKHYSTLSFTRTVPNDVNWDADDDEGDWNLSRSDTDPFQFMSPSDRTNSFPVVPSLAESETAPSQEQPLASSQAMDIIQEVDNEIQKDVLVDDEPAAPITTEAPELTEKQVDAAIDAWDLDATDSPEDASFFEGATAGAATDEPEQATWDAPGARYEEGVPLIPNVEATDAAAEPAKQPETKGPFDETDGGEDDDFFNTAGASADAEPASFSPPAFERKSTMQVLQSMNVGSLSREDSQPVDSPVQSPTKEEATIPEEPEPIEETAEKPTGDLAAKWAEVFNDEDELLEESILETEETEAAAPIGTKALDPAAFFGDDDEGFLEDDLDVPAAVPVAHAAPAATANRYLPQDSQAPLQQPQHQANPYLPAPSFAPAAQPVIPSPYVAPGAPPNQFPAAYGYDQIAQVSTQPQPRPTLHKAQSFADKSKGGYSSPYDLPMDVVKMPRKRQSLQQLPKAMDAMSALPPRGSSLAKEAMLPPPPPSAGFTSPASSAPVSTPLTKNESFFEDLPILPKTRPASRHSQRSPSQQQPMYGLPQTPSTLPPPPQAQGPPQASPYAPAQSLPQTPAVPPPTSHYAPPVAPAPPASAPPSQPPIAQSASTTIGGLVAPPKANPYASLQPTLGTPGLPPPVGNVSRYSPSPNQLATPNGPPPSSRYSPAPPNRVPSAGYVPSATPPILAHQPRTSSPLAHFEISYDKPRTSSVGGHVVIHGEGHVPERRSSSSMFEPRLNRVPSLPPTREEEEDQSAVYSRPASSGSTGQQQFPPIPPSQASQTSQYSPLKQRHTPPPQANAYSQATLSPPKRILNYAPHAEAQSSPPRRSQSPGSVYGNRAAQTTDQSRRPSSSHQSIPVPVVTRPRAPSQSLNLVPPSDGTETDPLQRWKGVPIFTWGPGGAFVSSFPQDIPRYGINQALPMIHRTPGEVQVKHIKELQPLDERLSKFPGPLKGKSKKKEVLSWLSADIESLEQSLPSNSFSEQVSLDDKRLEERVLLWKVLRLLVEHDGVLEGTEAVDKAVRGILVPNVTEEATGETSADSNLDGAGAGYVGFHNSRAPGAQADTVDSAVVEKIRKNLLLGDKEKAVWDAVDKRLWGHAFLVAGAASRELFKKVAQEFVHKEVNTPGLNNESLAALYEVLSGNHEECVDELVPVHARAGLQLMTTQPSVTQPRDDGLAGLDKWCETLSLILSNRSTDDVQAIHSLGNLLAGYGRAEAAHVCYLFSRSVTVFGGLDDPAANFVLLGADHKGQVDSFAKETDAVLLSEVYEYGLSLAGSSSTTSNIPHLAAYKLQHAIILAEYGLRDRALQYCEAIVAAMSSQTRRSPYYHTVLETAVEDLTKRLKSSPKEESNSWIPKPSMNKVSDTMWNRFNKFVAGDEVEGADGAGAGPEGSAESSIFSRIASGTPTISRPTSSHGMAGATGMEMFGGHGMTGMPSPAYGAMHGATIAPPAPSSSAPPTRAGSRYAPGAAPVTPVMNTYDPNAGYTPMSMATSGIASPPSVTSPYEPVAGYTPLGMAAPVITVPAASPYEPSAARAVSNGASSPYAPSSRRVSADNSTSGEPAPYLPRSNSELSPAYSPYAPGPGSAGLKPSLSRKSSYTPLAQAEPAAPVTSYAPVQTPTDATPSYNPYAPSNEATSSPYTPAAAPEPEQEKNAAEAEVPSYGYQAPSYGYEPPTINTPYEPVSDEPTTTAEDGADAGHGEHTNGHANGYGGYEPPPFQPYSYEPPSFEPTEPDAEGASHEDEDAHRPKKMSFMDDDGDDVSVHTSAADRSREEKDRENAEMFRKIAEEEEKRAAAEKDAKAKKGWGLTSWWGKKDAGMDGAGSGGAEAPKAVRAKLGEKSSFYFDPEQKRWINKNASPEDQAAKSGGPPPPPRSMPGSARSTPPPPAGGPPTSMGPPSMGPPMGGRPASSGGPYGSALPMLAPPMVRTSSAASTASGPPSRPTTSMSDANSIDDLLGAAPGPRKGAKKGRKSGRYVDVMAK